MPQALDAAYPRWTPALLKQLGIVAVGRYVSWKPNAKVITKAEYDGYLAAAIAVFLVWESTGTDYVGGYAAGYRAGAEARKQARELSHPDERPIFWTIDTGAVFTQASVDYGRGFNDGGGCGLQGFYGDVQIGDHLLDGGIVRVFWQTNARAWPGDATDSPRAALIQRTSKSYPALPASSYDESDIVLADFGQHPSPAPVQPPTPTPPPPTSTTTNFGDEPMKLTEITMTLDEKGNGHVPVADVKAADVFAIFPVGTPDPAVSHGYVSIPRLALTIGTDANAEVVVEGGVPHGRCSVRVVHA